MPASRNYLIEGINLPSDCISPQDLLMLVRAASPENDIGFVIVGASSPDVAVNPETARFVYRDPAGFLYYYDGTGWVLVRAAAYIADKSLKLIKLDPETGNAYKIIRVSASGTQFEFVYINDIINNLPVNKLQGQASAALLATSSNNVLWRNYTDVWNQLVLDGTPGSMDVTLIAPGSNRNILYTNVNTVAWGDVNTVIPYNTLKQNRLEHNTIVLTPAATVIVDASLGIQFKLTCNQDTTINITNMTSGQSIQLLIVPSGNTVSVPNVKWPGGALQTLQGTATVLSFSKFESDIYGAVVTNYS